VTALVADRSKPLLCLSQGIASVAATLMNVGIFFFTQHAYGWTIAQNFRLSASQGAVYIVGALLSGRLSKRFGRQGWCVISYGILTAITALAGFAHHLSDHGSVAVAALAIAYSGVAASTWPALESLAISGGDAHQMSRSTAIYNLTWSGTGALAIALTGALIKWFGPGYFLVAAGLHVLSGALMVAYGNDAGHVIEHAHEPPPEELQRSRTLALWLARVAMPATYIVIYALAAAMPELPVIKPLGPAIRTFASSAWLIGRFLAFVFLGVTTFWHVRPRLLLVATIVMLFAFIGVTVPMSHIFGPGAAVADLAAMVSWQLALGLVLGLIYAGSLYFGMVLAHGSTEQGGYHEALIGLGSVLGPGTGAVAAMIRPGDLSFSIRAVTGLVIITTIATIAVSAVARRRHNDYPVAIPKSS
jgi:MFS family permease